MREIKFRGWDEENKVMMPAQDLSQSRVYWPWLGVKDFTLMQFTGLHDKNGKEIYEGDVVRFIVDGNRWPVLFEKGAYRVGLNGLASLNLANHEVIGNIYENQELLKD
ncbi:MAG: YopX family protein [Pseudolabrys sp.]